MMTEKEVKELIELAESLKNNVTKESAIKTLTEAGLLNVNDIKYALSANQNIFIDKSNN